MLLDLLARQGLADDGQLPSIGIAPAAGLQGTHQPVHVLKIHLLIGLVLFLPGGNAQQHALPRRLAQAVEQQCSLPDINFFAEIDARQLPFQRPAQVLHGAVQQLRVGGIGHDAKVQIDARGATIEQIQQTHGLLRVK